MKSITVKYQLNKSPKEFAQILDHQLLSRNLDSPLKVSSNASADGVVLLCESSVKDKFYNPAIMIKVDPTETGCYVTVCDVANLWSPARVFCFWLFSFFLLYKVVNCFMLPSSDNFVQAAVCVVLLLATSIASENATGESRRREKLIRDFVGCCVYASGDESMEISS